MQVGHLGSTGTQLGTFGAIMGFAIVMEGTSADFYEQAARGEAAETFASLARGSRQRQKRLERARRELVSEMILESISGLDQEAYQLVLDTQATAAEALRQALALEVTLARYYREAGAKMPIPEVVRLFDRLARENDRRQAQVLECAQRCGL